MQVLKKTKIVEETKQNMDAINAQPLPNNIKCNKNTGEEYINKNSSPKYIEKPIQLLPKTVQKTKKLYNASDEHTSERYTDIIEATEAIAKTVADLHKLEELKKQLLANEDRLKLEVMDYMQVHSQLSSEGIIIVSWKRSTRRNLDIAKFKNELPDLYNSYLQDISIRSFRLL